ncbi:hypothetical protein GW17_00024443, partial [Ensete ventricosum]
LNPFYRSKRLFKQQDFSSRCSPKGPAPESRDTPPKRGLKYICFFDIFLLDTGIASEKEWGINLLDEKVNESGTNEDGSTWYRESGEELGDNGYRCRWAKMGGQSYDGSSEWKETWWEKSDWTGYKELGMWEKYDAKGWTEKGAHKYGRLNEQSWWEKWGEHYDGRGFVLKWFDCLHHILHCLIVGQEPGEKNTSAMGKYTNMAKVPQEKAGISLWMKKPIMSEFKSNISMNRSYVRAEPHYGWAEVVGDSTQLLSIQPQERPPGVYPSLDFGASEPQKDDPPDEPLKQ